MFARDDVTRSDLSTALPLSHQIDAAFQIQPSTPIINLDFMMDEDRILADRAAMERRVAKFRETQTRFQRERDDYYDSTIEKVRATDWNEFASPPDQE